MQVINWVDNEAFWEQKVILGGVQVILEAEWNVRDEAWYLSIYKSDETPLIVGRKLTLNVDLLKLVHDEGKPQGVLAAVAITTGVSNITRDNVGTDVELVFVGNDEVL
jgi:hypothetical protein